jgi:hypothetical protein
MPVYRTRSSCRHASQPSQARRRQNQPQIPLTAHPISVTQDSPIQSFSHFPSPPSTIADGKPHSASFLMNPRHPGNLTRSSNSRPPKLYTRIADVKKEEKPRLAGTNLSAKRTHSSHALWCDNALDGKDLAARKRGVGR